MVIFANLQLTLSLYNWYVLRSSANIKPGRIINYGLWATEAKDIKYKVLVMPILLNNNSLKPGLVTDLGIEFTGKNGKKSLTIRRRVELDMPSITALRNMNATTFRDVNMKDLNPFYPITVRGQEGTMIMLDCFDQENLINLDEDMTCKISVSYGLKKNSTVSFPFKLSSEDFNAAKEYIKWFRP